MKKTFDTYKPDGFHTLNAYLFVMDPQALINFYEKAFHAEELSRTINPQNGDIANVILKIGDSCFMLSQARGQFEGMRTSFYLFVDDVDAMFQNALAHGAQTVFELADMEYGDRQGGVEDPGGNYWWISKRLVEKGY